MGVEVMVRVVVMVGLVVMGAVVVVEVVMGGLMVTHKDKDKGQGLIWTLSWSLARPGHYWDSYDFIWSFHALLLIQRPNPLLR